MIKSLLKNNKEVDTLNEGDEGIIIVNQTPFYAESQEVKLVIQEKLI